MRGSSLSSWSCSAKAITSSPKVRKAPSKNRSIKNIWPGMKVRGQVVDCNATVTNSRTSNDHCRGVGELTDDVDEGEELTEEVSVSPPVVVFQVI